MNKERYGRSPLLDTLPLFKMENAIKKRSTRVNPTYKFSFNRELRLCGCGKKFRPNSPNAKYCPKCKRADKQRRKK